MMELVDVRLDHPRGGAPLVMGAHLKVAAGEVVVIVGAAGVGTSRMVAAALGEVAPAAGRIEVLGRDVGKLRRSSLRLMRRRIGIIPQDLCLLEDRTAHQNVMLPLEIDGIPASISAPRAAACLARMGLEAESMLPVDCLSASVRQRVAVARALVRDPQLVLADHPTSAQDPTGCALVCDALADVASRGATVVVFARDPALRAAAAHHGWRQLGMLDGALRPLDELELDGRTIEDILVGIESAPTTMRPEPAIDPAIPNVIPFPITARTAGAR